MKIKDLVPGIKILSDRENPEQISRMIEDHYRMQLGGFISEARFDAWGASVYSQISVDSMWNHFALLPGCERTILPDLEKIETAALEHRRFPGVYITAESPSAEEAAVLLIRANYEVLKVESWMTFQGKQAPVVPTSSSIPVKQVETESELEDFVDIFNDSFSTGQVYMGDALKSQFYSQSFPDVRHFIGYVTKTPVCIATVTVDREGNVCIYNVGTAAAHRRKGYGAVITSYLINESIKVGHKTLFLQADYGSGAERIYKRLGFEELFHRIGFVRSDCVIPEHEAESFWRSCLGDIKAPTRLPPGEISPVRSSSSGDVRAVEYREIPAAAAASADDYTAKCGLSLDILLTGLCGLIFSRYCNEETALLGLEYPGKKKDKYIFPMPITMDSFTDPELWLRSIDERKNRIEEFGVVPLPEIHGWSRIPGEYRLFDIVLEFTEEKFAPLEEKRIYPLVCRFLLEQKVFEVNYDRRFYSKDTIRRLTGQLLHLLEEIPRKDGHPPNSLEIVTAEEKKQILFDFNDTYTIYPEDKFIHDFFKEQAVKTPDQAAISGPAFREVKQDGKTPFARSLRKAYLTYGELDRQAGSLAGVLLSKGIGPDSIAGIMIHPSLEMIIGILAVLKAGAAYLPVAVENPEERTHYLLADSRAAVVLTAAGCIGNAGTFEDLGVEQICIDNAIDRSYKSPTSYSAVPDDLAYIIYTSGSTGQPKGVMVEHSSVVNILLSLQDSYPMSASDRYLLKTSFIFDVSVAELFGWFFNGGSLVIMGAEQRKEPQKILDEIASEKITHVNFVPSLFAAFLELPDLSEILKLSCLKYIFLAGEALAPPLVKRFMSLRSGVILENLYGPTEGTVYVSAYSLSQWDGGGHIPIGKPLPNISLYVLDKKERLQPVGVPGELMISGAGVALGYLNNPELTAEKFIRNHFKRTPAFTYRSALLYKTGDLARWLPDGDLEFLGRIDHQIKIRGFRVELGEIEHRLRERDDIQDAVVIAKRYETGDTYLCAYIVAGPPHSPPLEGGPRSGRGGLESSLENKISANNSIGVEIREYLSRILPEYMIPSVFVHLEKLPLTPTGKVDRKSLPEPEKRSAAEYSAPKDEIEKKLIGIWAEVLGLDRGQIGINDHFFNLGGHSLKGTILISKIHREFNVRLSLSDVFRMPLVRTLSGYIKDAVKDKFSSLESIEKRDYYALSSAQKRLYVLNRMEFDSISYNMPLILELDCEANKKRLEETFRRLIARHDSFRTSFHMIDGEPLQRVHDPEDVEFKIEYYEAGNRQEAIGNKKKHGTRPVGDAYMRPETGRRGGPCVPPPLRAVPEIIDSFIRPFDLSKAPLIRACVANFDKGRDLLLIDMHHIISDGISLDIFNEELLDIYDANALPALRVQYKDFAAWHDRQGKKGNLKRRQDYWLNVFAGEIPVLNLMTDYPRPKVQSFAGSNISFDLPGEVTEVLKKLAREENVTLFMVLAAQVSILLAKLSGQDDIVLGTPAEGRSHPDAANIVGMFVNTLPLRNFPEGNKTFKEFLSEIKRCTLNAFENQDYPFEDLVESVNVSRDAGRNPLFDVMLILRNIAAPQEETRELKFHPHTYNDTIAKFDLSLFAEEREGELSFCLQYCTKLFKQETVNRCINYFRKIIAAIAENPDIHISEVEIISAEEKQEILCGFNDTGTDYPRHKTIGQLFFEQVEQTPDHTAAVELLDPGESSERFDCTLSCRELDRMSSRFVPLLLEKGVQPGSVIGIMAERSIEMLTGVLGILKAGGAYLPIDPGYPRQRKSYMLGDSGAKILLITKDCKDDEETFRSLQVERILLEDVTGSGGGTQDAVSFPNSNREFAQASSLAYIIYTSGSTGQPKGVMVDHFNVVRLVKNSDYVEFRPGDRVLPTGALEFDASTFEIWGGLLNGLGLYLVSEDVILSPARLKEAIRKNDITTMWLTSPLFNQLLQEDIGIFAGLRNLLVGGDVLSPHHINRLIENYPSLNIINGYGPTENTTFSTTYLISEIHSASIPIGRPIANSTAYIVDRRHYLQPVGIPGELLVGGDGVARGYMNNPELTAEKFPNAWVGVDNYPKQKFCSNFFNPAARGAVEDPSGHLGAAHHLNNLPKQKFCSNFFKTPLRGESMMGVSVLFENIALDLGFHSGERGARGLDIHENQLPVPLEGARAACYKTGDLCRWLPGGNIEFLGRIDQQVKIRGFRIELGEIENRLLLRDDIKEAVVTVRDDETGEKYLCAYIVARRESRPVGDAYMRPNPDVGARRAVPSGQESRGEPGVPPSSGLPGSLDSAELREHISRTLPDYMIPSFFVFLDKMPLTPNGKVDRKRLPEPEKGSSKDYRAPRGEVEKRLVDIWSRVLGLGKDKIGIDDNFFELGGHSLKGTVVITAIHKEFNVSMSLGQIFNTPRICKIADYIKSAAKDRYIPVEIAEEKEYYELSYAQRRLWILCQFEEESTAYNMPFAFILTGSLQTDVFEQALQRLAGRHDSLRTVFVSVKGEPKQRILDKMDFKLEQADLRDMAGEAKEQQGRELFLEGANRVLNLETGPLFLFKLVRFDENTYLWILNIHHIVNDGWSQGILDNEIFALYNAFLKNEANPLPPLKLKYCDYTLWHNELIKGDHFRKAESYWLEKFKDKPNGIELPLDHSRKPVQTFNGGRVNFSIDETTTSKLHRLCFAEEATLFMGLLSLLGVLLYKYTYQRDIIIGLPIAGRKRQELNNIVGFLVNTLVFRSELDPGKSFKELVKGIKQETLDCYENQDYPFDILIEKLELERDLSQSPLFNVMLAHNNAETLDTKLAMEGVTLSDYPYFFDFNMSKFDLIFFMVEEKNRIEVMLEYNSDLFDQGTVERLSKNLVTLLEHILEDANGPVSELRCMDEAEYKEVVEEFNDRNREYPLLSIQELFENQAQKSGEKQAVVFTGETITYRTLNERVNRFAHYLREVYRVKPNDVVGISMERSVDMIVVLLGIIKSGGAYLALDPTYPRDRVLHVLGDSRTDILVIDKMRPELFAGSAHSHTGRILNINEHREKIEQQSKENPGVVNRPSDILYVNYTSGSTGTPNGAMLSHDILANLILWQKNDTVIDCSLRCLQFTSINFCVSFQEIIGTLTSGGELHLIGDVERQDIDYLMDFLSERRIENLFLPFSYLNFLFNESGRWDRSFNHNLKHIITAGEQLKITVGLKRFLDLNPHIRLHNHYGSTEMHVVTSYTLDASTADKTPIPPAGKPVGNTAIYILDEHLRPVPIGVWGELCVKGSSSVPGYINNEELNKKKLLHHPELSADKRNLYRSGDIGRWHEDGNIELRGRMDFQVKIRGFRVEPGEIESRILSIKGVRECVVVVKEDEKKQKYLAAYVVIAGIDVPSIKRILGGMLPLYMVPRLVVLEHLPLMPNGKVDRDNLPEPEFSAGGEIVPPRNKVEEKLARIWAEILTLDKESISIDANFFDLGGHSLKATVMTAYVQKELQVKVPLSDIFKAPTIAEMAVYIAKEAALEAYVPLRPVEEREYYPLSPAQKRIYIVEQTKPGTTTYNMPLTFVLIGSPDRGKITRCFKESVKRHESFRTSFHLADDQPVQRVHKSGNINFEIEYYEDVGAGLAPAHEDFVRSFDLTKAPLLRVRLIKEAEDRFILMTDIHHIIFDGVSYNIFFREFKALYKGKGLPELKLQYKDFSRWQTGEIQAEARKKHESFWLEEFAGEVPRLKLPLDYDRGESFSYEGDTMSFSLPKEKRDALLEFIRQEDVTLFMLLLAVFYVLLAKICDQEDIVIGIPAAGREHADLRHIIGMFVNPLPLRNFPRRDKTFRQFLHEVKERSLLAYENRDCQYEGLIERLNLNRKSGRNEIFNVMFTLQNLQEKSENYLEIDLPGIKSKLYEEVMNKVSRFDITFYAFEEEDRIDCFFEYSTQLFSAGTIEIMQDRYLKLLDGVIRDRACKIEDIQYKTAVEDELNETGDVEFDF